jgi:two-component system, OmpR family, sensor histidine kinase CpxA
MIRGISLKIFLWFSLAMAATSGAVFLITVLTHSQSLGSSWMTGVLDQYARSAMEIYVNGGKVRLSEYLREIDDTSHIQSTLYDPEYHDILGLGVPAGAERVFTEALATGQSQFNTGLRWTGASVVVGPGGRYILVAKVIIPYGWLLRGALQTTVLGWLMPALCGALLSLLLARHLTAPIRGLQLMAGRIADGDLSVRASPAMSSRHDELADLALAFDKMTERIQSLLHKQQELLADISHELRSPLTRLSVSLELLRRGETDAVARMQTDMDRLNILISQILTLARLESHADSKNELSFNLRSILESVVEDADFEGKEKEKAVLITHADDCSLQGDPALLRSCIENVIRNAVYYTKPRTEVLVSLRRASEARPSAQIVVVDRGQGVPEQALPRLFEPFYRVPESPERKPRGTGLGLAIAQRIAITYGGSIRARNVNDGLEVEIRLPCAT